MEIEVISKNIEVTPAIKDLIAKKGKKLSLFVSDNTEVKFMIDANKKRHKIEATIYLDGVTIRAEQRSDDLYKTIDQTIDVLIKRVKNYKEKKNEKKLRGNSIRYLAENIDENPIESDMIIRRKSFKINTMAAEDACDEMEYLGHDFFVFTDSETDQISVVYKREDGGYGMIAAE